MLVGPRCLIKLLPKPSTGLASSLHFPFLLLAFLLVNSILLPSKQQQLAVIAWHIGTLLPAVGLADAAIAAAAIGPALPAVAALPQPQLEGTEGNAGIYSTLPLILCEGRDACIERTLQPLHHLEVFLRLVQIPLFLQYRTGEGGGLGGLARPSTQCPTAQQRAPSAGSVRLALGSDSPRPAPPRVRSHTSSTHLRQVEAREFVLKLLEMGEEGGAILQQHSAGQTGQAGGLILLLEELQRVVGGAQTQLHLLGIQQTSNLHVIKQAKCDAQSPPHPSPPPHRCVPQKLPGQVQQHVVEAGGVAMRGVVHKGTGPTVHADAGAGARRPPLVAGVCRGGWGSQRRCRALQLPPAAHGKAGKGIMGRSTHQSRRTKGRQLR